MASDTTWLTRIQAAALSKRLSIFLLICSLLFYGWLVYRAVVSWDTSSLDLMKLHWEGLLIATGIQAVGYLFAVYLWGLLIKWLERESSFLDHLRIYAYSGLAVKLPGLFWGVAARLYLYNRIGISKSAVGVAAGLETVLIGVASSFLSVVLIVLQPNETPTVPLPVLIAACVLLAVLTHPRVLHRLLSWLPNKDVLEALERLSWWQILRMTGAHLIILVMGGLCLCGVMSSVVGYSPSLVSLSVRTWALTVAWSTVLAWLPADFGLRNGPFLLILSSVFPAPTAIILLIVWRIWVNLTELGWGAVGFLVHGWSERMRARRHGADTVTTMDDQTQSIPGPPILK